MPQNEEWREIPGWGGRYQVSNLGRVKSIYRNGKSRVLSPNVNCRRGYLSVNLYDNAREKRYYVHRLVATAFIPNPERFPQVNHKDENKANNNVANLEWCSNLYNHNYGTCNERMSATKRTAVIAYDENGNFFMEFTGAKAAGAFYGVTVEAIYRNIWNNSRNKKTGHSFKYKQDEAI